MLEAKVRSVLEGRATAHLATTLADGGPHVTPVWVGAVGERVVFFTGPDSRKARNLRRDPRVAISIAPAENPFEPVLIRGRVVEWLDGDAAWTVIDQIATKYIGQPYSRELERIVALIEPERQRVGIS